MVYAEKKTIKPAPPEYYDENGLDPKIFVLSY